jgi:hypothetical protein
VTVTKKTRRTIGKVVTIAGATLIGTGILVGVFANGKYEDQFKGTMPHCSPGDPPLCDPTGQSNTDSAITLAYVGTAIGVTGGVALAVGAYLWFFAPKDAQVDTGVALVPTMSPDSAGLSAVGHF